MYKILLLDDEEDNLKATSGLLKEVGYSVVTTTSPEKVMKLLDEQEFALLLSDYKMPTRGDAVVEMVRKAHPHQQIAMYSCDLTQDSVKNSWKAGAIDFFEKTMPTEDFLKKVEAYCKKYELFLRPVRTPSGKLEARKFIETAGMIGASKSTMDVVSQIHKIAPTDATVLIRGESGTGKELVAKGLHNLSPRAKNNFVAVNCGSIPPGLLESELFGHMKGSFSGAIENKIGKFKLAHNGTLFLDEIGEMALELQAKLLRAIQEKEITPVGGKMPEKINVRFLAATNRNLQEMVKKGTFREDLLYRIQVIEIELQPLRNRLDDIEPLVEHFTDFYNKKYQKKKIFQHRAIEFLKKNPWHGNVRELQSTIERHIILTPDNKPIIQPDDLDLKFFEVTETSSLDLTMEQYWQSVADNELDFLADAIEKAGGNKAEAARRLNITPRHLQHLINKQRTSKTNETVI